MNLYLHATHLVLFFATFLWALRFSSCTISRLLACRRNIAVNYVGVLVLVVFQIIRLHPRQFARWPIRSLPFFAAALSIDFMPTFMVYAQNKPHRVSFIFSGLVLISPCSYLTSVVFSNLQISNCFYSNKLAMPCFFSLSFRNSLAFSKNIKRPISPFDRLRLWQATRKTNKHFYLFE